MNKNYINIYNNLIKFSRNKKLFSIFTKEDSFSDRLIIFLLHFGFFLKIYKNNENRVCGNRGLQKKNRPRNWFPMTPKKHKKTEITKKQSFRENL